MAYYVRLLTRSDQVLSLDELRDALDDNMSLSVDVGDKDAWEQLLLVVDDGTEVAVIERNPISDGSLGSDEIAEFIDEISGCKPDSSVQWLTDYLPKIRTVYAFQLLSGSSEDAGGRAFDIVRNYLWSSLGGIFQADYEGFSNEDGYHILWQFNDHVSGPWQMGLLQNGRWVHFGMELGDRKQRESFFNGQIPDGAAFD